MFSTLHTNDASQAIDRIIDVFPAFRQEQIRVQLSACLGAVIAQRLVPRIDGGMVAAFEVLVANNPVRNLIREGKTNQLLNVITTNQSEGMCTMESSLVDLIRSETITYDDAMTISVHPKELDRLLSHRDDGSFCVTADAATRHGPKLPYSIVAGVTPCRGGWLVASAKLQGTIFAARGSSPIGILH